MRAPFYKYFILFLLVLEASGCQEVDREILVKQLIEEKLEERKNIFSEAIFRNCLEEIRDDAQAAADSIIRTRINLNPVDSLVKPAKPAKPAFPDLVPPVDTFYVNPQKKLKRDSLPNFEKQ